MHINTLPNLYILNIIILLCVKLLKFISVNFNFTNFHIVMYVLWKFLTLFIIFFLIQITMYIVFCFNLVQSLTHSDYVYTL